MPPARLTCAPPRQGRLAFHRCGRVPGHRPGRRGEEVEGIGPRQAPQRRRRCGGAEQGERVLAQGGETGEHDEQREQHRRHADREPAQACTGRERRPETADLDLV
ncbi:MAG TPA: hypothetical protein VF916_05970, partial [Ktedonobacterales bacterium]